jgi:hypothetical protein
MVKLKSDVSAHSSDARNHLDHLSITNGACGIPMVGAPQTGIAVSRHRRRRLCSNLALLLQGYMQKARVFVKPGILISLLRGCAHANAAFQNYIRHAGVMVSNLSPLSDDFSGPTDPSPQLKSLDDLETVISESPPWLGPSPSATLKISYVAGQQKGKYRLWCQVPPRIYKATIYRHKTSEHKLVTIGLEFYHDFGSALLGFRTLWTEHSKEVEFDEGEKIIGVRFERDNRFIQVPLAPPSHFTLPIYLLTPPQKALFQIYQKSDKKSKISIILLVLRIILMSSHLASRLIAATMKNLQLSFL